MIGPSTQNLSYKLCLLIDIADNSQLSTFVSWKKNFLSRTECNGVELTMYKQLEGGREGPVIK